jgi:hypothetical protein
MWNQRRHQQTIPYHPLANTPSFRTALALRTYQAFVALFEAAEAQYHQWEHVLQMPGQIHHDKEFTAKKNVHAGILKKPLTASEGATSNNLTVQASNLLSEKGDKEEKQTTRTGPLTFNVNPELEKDMHVYLVAVNDQAELMCWHYRLGHLAFSKLKQLALNGEIPQQLAKVKPPACMGCLFGAMTKVSWRGRETSSKVFGATKARQCVSVDQMISTQVGFIAQLNRQHLTFYGVNAHFQNGIAEKAIKDLQESARKQLLHARQCWPAAIHLALWPYTLRSTVHLHNTLPV